MANPEYKIKSSIGAEKRSQLNYNEISKATKQLDVLPIPYANFSDATTAGVLVKKGTLCRVFGTTNDFIAFGPVDVATPTSSTQNAAKMSQAVHMIVATDDYIRCSATVTRVELIED